MHFKPAASALLAILLLPAATASAHLGHAHPAPDSQAAPIGLFALSASTSAAPSAAKAPARGEVALQLLTVSDWHGQLTPLGAGATAVGGAPALKAYFDEARVANPNTLTFMAGDSFGASPPISSFFEEEPAIQAMNMMGVSADTFGNHSFDKGVGHLQRMVDLARFPFVAANVKGLEESLDGVAKREMFNVAGVRVAVIGIVNEEAPTLVAPDALGDMVLTDSVAAANRAARQARAAGAEVVVVLTHKGIRGTGVAGAFGELVNFADGVDPELVNVIVGDHTDLQYSGLHNGVLAVENKSKGATFAKIQLTVNETGVTSKAMTFHTPLVSAVTPDAAITDYIAGLTTQLAPVLGTVIGDATVAIPRADACANSAGRICESKVGNVVADALRTTYGTDFAITNSGGLRADLTCPGAGVAAFCPAVVTPPPFPITRGGVLGVLPFGNVSTTTTVSGAEVRAFLENGVSAMPGVNGKFPQVSGLCFTYDIAAAAGSRVTSIVRQAADGSCTGPAVDAATTYTLASNDFMANGGDGYPVVMPKSTTRNIMDADVAAYVTANAPLTPAIQGRIVCTGAGCPADLAAVTVGSAP